MGGGRFGTCGDAQWPDRKAIALELEFGISCLRRSCGLEPAGCSLEVVWHEHDAGAYATISLVWPEGSLSDDHWKYIDRCSQILDQLDDCVDWEALHTIRATGTETPSFDLKDWPPRGLDERMFYCRCCPHRPLPAYSDMHYPFANCSCCPRHIPEYDWDPASRRSTRCRSCRDSDRQRMLGGGVLGLMLGVSGTAWLVAPWDGRVVMLLVWGAAGLLVVWTWWRGN